MNRIEQRKAERDSMLYHYRDYERAHELTTEDGSLAVVFTKPALAPKCFLLAFAGTAGNAAMHYSYRTIEAATEAAAAFMRGRQAHADRIEQHWAERRAFRTGLKVGTVLVNTWGYDQTNVEYFQVIEVSASGRSVIIRPIAAKAVEDGFMSGVCWPLADHFIGPAMVKRVGVGDSVKIHDWGSWAHPWTPKADRWTAYA